jgi:hypothetical protein
LVPGLFVVRQLKILCEGDVERFQVVRAVALVTMAITPYIMPDPWSGITVIGASLGLLVSFFLEPKPFIAGRHLVPFRSFPLVER